tara:strand:- start:15668 stop:17605 length:1938 start_codon:yes stop_codon:yes gene_type:complete
MLQWAIFFAALFPSQAYLEEQLVVSNDIHQVGVADRCTLYSTTNGTVLIMHDQTQTLQVKQTTVLDVDRERYSTSLASNIIAVNNRCDLVLFGFPDENRVALWRPQPDTVDNIVPSDIQREPVDGPSVAVFQKTYNVTGLDNVVRVQLSNTVARFGFAIDVQDQTWVVGAPGTPSTNGQGGTPGYAFVFEGTELHSCRSSLEMSCYPDSTGCVTGIDNWKNYYGKLKSAWASQFVPAYSDVEWSRPYTDSASLHISDVKKVQKLCLPLEKPYYQSSGRPMDELVYDAHRENYQQFGYAVAITGDLKRNGSALFVSAPGDTHRFMEDNAGANYGRVYVWDNVLWPDGEQGHLSWWQPSVYTPLVLPLELAAYQAFGRDIAAARDTLAVSMYPLYEDTKNPFVILYHCNPEESTKSNCEPMGGISIDDIQGNPLSYLTPDEITYMDGKTNWPYVPVPPNDFQNKYIGANIGIVGSNVLVDDPQNNNVYRFNRQGEWRQEHKTLATSENKPAKTGFATNSEHWVSQNGATRLTHYWSCALGHVGGRHQCIPAQHSYYSDDGWELYSFPCPRNYTTTETGRSSCQLWEIVPLLGPTWADTLFIMMMVVIGTCMCCVLLTCWERRCVKQGAKTQYKAVPAFNDEPILLDF